MKILTNTDGMTGFKRTKRTGARYGQRRGEVFM